MGACQTITQCSSTSMARVFPQQVISQLPTLLNDEEHYYQSLKFSGAAKDKILMAPNASVAHELGCTMALEMPWNVWVDTRIKGMKKVIREKFKQHENLKRILLGIKTFMATN